MYTRFGLHAGKSTEPILMLMLPLARFEYQYKPVTGSAEVRLAEYLRMDNWLAEAEIYSDYVDSCDL
ncbi:hypothetical protein BGI40_07460 [Snodgrassella communis]|nr:coproporphyrinogen III oxidase [Snodgrassella communis]KDN13538.1 hypothetical protein SALWKB12_0393 [Snodgrassella communis]PIT12012.1 hypothetical protein BGI29_02960 [Snodgrassella communis]PIT20675.1 hypothetical protein BGI35_07410 [Snodgrassella communis]PIT21593.1 hypothetical protein BGI36_05535 [Snodgrassella communis]PIT28997.1 hypothetical protein BGI39_04475 [Snodgrassella communis]